jgi:serine/threonine protein kinase
VWLYRDDELDSPVAVKALADNWAQREDVRERFLEEARILRRADSDHVVRVYDIGEVDGTPYFVMSYADRGSLAMLLEPGRPLPLDQVVDLITQAGEGVTVLHENGIIHRDLKPQNLLLRTAPGGGTRVQVADLGVAKAMLHASGLTQVVGTPAYMAPEQASGLGIDQRADVHALGAVAYHLLTGRLVRTGGIAVLSSPELPPRPSHLVDVPTAVDDVLFRALDPDREQRWPDVATFTTALQRAATDPVSERPTVGVPLAPAATRVLSESSMPAPGPQPPVPVQPSPVQPSPVRLSPVQLSPAQASPVEPGMPLGSVEPLDDQRQSAPGAVILLLLIVLVLAFAASYGVTVLLR